MQVFHTKNKQGVVIHPTSVFASDPEVLLIPERDSQDLGISRSAWIDVHQQRAHVLIILHITNLSLSYCSVLVFLSVLCPKNQKRGTAQSTSCSPMSLSWRPTNHTCPTASGSLPSRLTDRPNTVKCICTRSRNGSFSFSLKTSWHVNYLCASSDSAAGGQLGGQ